MTWLDEAMKDGDSTDIFRGAATGCDPEESEWGNPVRFIAHYLLPEIQNRAKEAKPGELKHLSTLRKRNHRDSLSNGERSGNSLNLFEIGRAHV